MTTKYKRIVFLTGAGISEESGISTFRSSDGLWNNHKVEDVATIEAYYKNQDFVHDFYNQMRPDLYTKQPNAAHLAITKLQNEYNADIHVITQNIDTLHEKAKTKNLYHMHGKINELVCLNCGHTYETWSDASSESICPQCNTQGMIKPNIVFFGEMPLYMNKIEPLLRSCDLFVSVGTSGVVYPAAGFVQTAKYYGAKTIEINLDPILSNLHYDKHITGKAGTTLPLFVENLLNENI
jgi:NAD-dependent deacetylase